MLLNELFDKPLPYKWSVKRNRVWYGTFEIGEMPYLVRFYDMYDDGKVEVSFRSERKIDLNARKEDKLLGTGNEFVIFSTIVNMIREYISSNPKCSVIWFSGNNSEPSRIKLYNRLCKVFGNQECKIDNDGIATHYYIEIKKR